MNCRPGDLAVIVRTDAASDRHLIGAICQVLYSANSWNGEPVWTFEAVSPVLQSEVCRTIYDRNLRPIRPDAGEDETLQWAGLPHKQGEPA